MKAILSDSLAVTNAINPPTAQGRSISELGKVRGSQARSLYSLKKDLEELFKAEREQFGDLQTQLNEKVRERNEENQKKNPTKKTLKEIDKAIDEIVNDMNELLEIEKELKLSLNQPKREEWEEHFSATDWETFDKFMM